MRETSRRNDTPRRSPSASEVVWPFELGMERLRERLFLTLRVAPLTADKLTRPETPLGQIPNRGIA